MKKTSVITLVSSLVFTAITFTSTKFASTFNDYSQFGWPFVFFSAEPEKQINSQNSFVLPALLIDVVLCVIISYLLVTVLSLFGVKRKREQLS
jgi:hypothetical protein